MRVVDTHTCRLIDNHTIRKLNISQLELISHVGRCVASRIIDLYSTCDSFAIFVGKGNNGADGLAIADNLVDKNKKVEVYLLVSPTELSVDSNALLQNLSQKNIPISNLTKVEFPHLSPNCIIIDAIFGIGINRSVSDFYNRIFKKINACSNTVIAVDIPSGLISTPTKTTVINNAVKADLTLTIQNPKLCLLLSDYQDYCGEFEIIDVNLQLDCLNHEDGNYFYITEDEVKRLYQPRSKYSHKGTYGHALLIAGSYGKAGAAVLASKSCLRTGVGLLTVHTPTSCLQIVQNCVYEAMCSPCMSEKIISGLPPLTQFDSIGIGPGIGTHQATADTLFKLLNSTTKPIVIDADAINILSQNKEWIKLLPKNTIITPHPKEFERIAGKASSAIERLELQRQLSIQNNIIVLLKGAHSSISFPNGKIYFNSSGNPGMATAGSGDVLTGIILSLLSQGYSPENATIMGTFIHGRAGDFAASEYGQNSLIARDIVNNINKVYR